MCLKWGSSLGRVIGETFLGGAGFSLKPSQAGRGGLSEEDSEEIVLGRQNGNGKVPVNSGSAPEPATPVIPGVFPRAELPISELLQCILQEPVFQQKVLDPYRCGSAGWASPGKMEVAGSIPGQGTYERQPMLQCRSMFLSLSLLSSPLCKNK